MKKLLVMILALLVIFKVSAQDARSICIKINGLNTSILNSTIKKAEAGKQFKVLIYQLNQNRTSPKTADHWVFPLKGYNYRAIGGTNGNGYSDKGYSYFDGNKHNVHPAQDIFINDKNQDCLDDKTNTPVEVLAIRAGYVIACSDSWNTASSLRGGKYIWIYDDYGQLDYYAHNGAIFVQPGDRVTQGQKIAQVGRSGYNAYKKRSPTHLHFSVFKIVNNTPVPFNPYQQLKAAGK
jgi:murein DD-endopeptidase MepM/ murein hydrolase activator NlpD